MFDIYNLSMFTFIILFLVTAIRFIIIKPTTDFASILIIAEQPTVLSTPVIVTSIPFRNYLTAQNSGYMFFQLDPSKSYMLRSIGGTTLYPLIGVCLMAQVTLISHTEALPCSRAILRAKTITSCCTKLNV
jgi:hypothetical protein